MRWETIRAPSPRRCSTARSRRRSLRWCAARRRRGAPAGRCGWWRWRRSSAASRRNWDGRRPVWRWRTMASSRGGKKMWCVPEISSEFIDRMEDVLPRYARKLNPEEPVVCLDERPIVLRDDARRGEPSASSKLARTDDEYVRCGIAEIFFIIDALVAAWRRRAEEEHRVIDWRFRVDDARRVFRYEGLTARRSEH